MGMGYDELYGLALEVSEALAESAEENAHLVHRINRLRMVLLQIVDDEDATPAIRACAVEAEKLDGILVKARQDRYEGKLEGGEAKGEAK